jgi:hypothetical protein
MSAVARELQRRPSLRRPILKPRKIAVKGARYARLASRRPLTANLVEDSEAPVGGMARSERSRVFAIKIVMCQLTPSMKFDHHVSCHYG